MERQETGVKPGAGRPDALADEWTGERNGDCIGDRTGGQDVETAAGWGLIGVLSLVLAFFAALLLLRGGLYIGQHEGDALHLADIAARMAAGDRPSLDFMTPLGALTALPFAVLMRAGLGFGHAVILGQILVALLLLPVVVRVAGSRLPRWPARAFGVVVVLFCLAVVPGGVSSEPSISMHYNRWCWALAYLAVLLVALPPLAGRTRPRVDGALLGLVFAVMVLVKMTYPVALALPLALGLWWHRRQVSPFWAVLATLAVALLATLWLGLAYWPAYLGDLLSVAQSDTRPVPSAKFGEVLTGPGYLGGHLVMLAAVILLRRAGRLREGLMLLLLLAGFIYISFQNYGNYQQWLALAALLLWSWRPACERGGTARDNGDPHRLAGVFALILAALALPGILTLARSPQRELATPKADTLVISDLSPVAPPTLSGLHLLPARVSRLMAVGPWEEGLGDLQRVGKMKGAEKAAPEDPPLVLAGQPLPRCRLRQGFILADGEIATDLVAAGYGGAAILTADMQQSLPLFGPFPPVKGAAPWYYVGAPGLEAADYLLVPLCPVSEVARDQMLRAILGTGWQLSPVRQTGFYILMEIAAASPGKAASDR